MAGNSVARLSPLEAPSPKKAQLTSYAAGLAGYGSTSYIEGVILRDDHEDDWTEAADSTMERRVYYCQNWRADVVAILAENGRIVEKAWYEPYGTPHGVSPADFSGTSDDTNDHYLVPDGDADADDSFVFLDLFGLSAGLSDLTGSSDPGDPEYGRPNGVIDSDDYFYYLDQFSVAAALGRNVLSAGHNGATASHGAGNLRNRKGLAGYEWDPHVRRYHVRSRVYDPTIGRWHSRDVFGYVDGLNIYAYVRGMPYVGIDPIGTRAYYAAKFGYVSNPRLPPLPRDLRYPSPRRHPLTPDPVETLDFWFYGNHCGALYGDDYEVVCPGDNVPGPRIGKQKCGPGDNGERDEQGNCKVTNGLDGCCRGHDKCMYESCTSYVPWGKTCAGAICDQTMCSCLSGAAARFRLDQQRDMTFEERVKYRLMQAAFCFFNDGAPDDGKWREHCGEPPQDTDVDLYPHGPPVIITDPWYPKDPNCFIRCPNGTCGVGDPVWRCLTQPDPQHIVPLSPGTRTPGGSLHVNRD